MTGIYHALNRGVEKRQIFLDDQDRARFVHDMYEFNDESPAGNAYRRFDPMMELRSPSLGASREQIVTIHAWCLMGNHYHLLLSEIADGGMSRFLRKLNIGYAMYFNEKYGRSGVLFQGRTKKIRIEKDAHFLHILHYIHLNPLDFVPNLENWRAVGAPNIQEALRYLEAYRWSSYLDYCKTPNFPSVIDRSLYEDTYPDYRSSVAHHLTDFSLPEAKALLLE